MDNKVFENKITIRYSGITGLIEESTQEIDLSKALPQLFQNTASINVEEIPPSLFQKLMHRWLELSYSKPDEGALIVTIDDDYIDHIKSYFNISQADILKLESMKGKTYSIYPTGISTLPEPDYEKTSDTK